MSEKMDHDAKSKDTAGPERYDGQSRIAVLKSEVNLNAVSVEDIQIRHDLLSQLRKLPDEAILKLKYFQPQIGCPNRCSFCSQDAGKELITISDSGMRNLVSALKTSAIEILG